MSRATVALARATAEKLCAQGKHLTSTEFDRARAAAVLEKARLVEKELHELCGAEIVIRFAECVTEKSPQEADSARKQQERRKKLKEVSDGLQSEEEFHAVMDLAAGVKGRAELEQRVLTTAPVNALIALPAVADAISAAVTRATVVISAELDDERAKVVSMEKAKQAAEVERQAADAAREADSKTAAAATAAQMKSELALASATRSLRSLRSYADRRRREHAEAVELIGAKYRKQVFHLYRTVRRRDAVLDEAREQIRELTLNRDLFVGHYNAKVGELYRASECIKELRQELRELKREFPKACRLAATVAEHKVRRSATYRCGSLVLAPVTLVRTAWPHRT